MKKIKLREVFLIEATCPSCGSKNAYVGMNTVECDNPSCRHYTGKQSSSGASGKKAAGSSAANQQWRSFAVFPDHFPTTYSPGNDYNISKPQFISQLKAGIQRLAGATWLDDIDKWAGNPGTADTVIEMLWKKGWGVRHAIDELAFYWDLATGGMSGGSPTPVSAYDHVIPDGNYKGPNNAYDYARDTGVEGYNFDDWSDNGGKNFGWDFVEISQRGSDPRIDPSDMIYRPLRK